MRIEMNQSGNSWLEFVQFFHKKNPELSYKQALQEASGPYNKMKTQHQKKRGGAVSFNNIDLKDPQLRFEAGVSALNSNLKNIGRSVIYGGSGVSFNNIDLKDPQLRFEAGVSALNSNLKNIGRSVIYGGKQQKQQKHKKDKY